MNRFEDGRFNEKRATFDSKSLKKVLEDVKESEGWTWSEFSEIFDVSMYTIRHDWRKKSDTVPLSVARRLEKLSNFELDIKVQDAFEGQRQGGLSSQGNGAVPENWSSELAEFYGAMLGDGCIYSNLNTMCVSGNAQLDEKYIYYLKDISESIFELKPKVYFQESENVVRLALNSRKISRFFRDSGFKLGEKSDKEFEIPNRVYDANLVKDVVRGLFDTDGGIYSHPNTGIMLDITAKNESIHDFLVEAVEILDLPLGITNDRVQLYGEENLDTFFKIVGSSNSRNIKRYLYYKENKELPEVTSTTLLKSGSNDIDVPYYGFMV